MALHLELAWYFCEFRRALVRHQYSFLLTKAFILFLCSFLRLFNLNRRLSRDENSVQVASTIVVAYLAFFTSEIICRCSGVIAVVFCGITTKYGEIFLNDLHLTHDFWHITELLLNSVLFTLGGAVWGSTPHFSGMDWIYLFILFGLLVFIRFVLVFAFYPITSRIGVGQSISEAVFMSYGGLRGAMGVALALLLSAEVYNATDSSTQISTETRDRYREFFADKLFGLVGGVSFLTLVLLGPTSGFVLKRLGLVTPTECRKTIVSHYVEHMNHHVLLLYLELLGHERFANVDFGIVQEHVSPLRGVTEKDLALAIKKYQSMNPGQQLPNLSNLKRYIASIDGSDREQSVSLHEPSEKRRTFPKIVSDVIARQRRETIIDYNTLLDKDAVMEERKTFLDLLRREYTRQLSAGELDSRGSIPLSLIRSLDIADEAAAKGLPLNDWAAAQTFGSIFKKGDRILHAYRVGGLFNRKKGDEDFQIIRQSVLQALSFIKAHLNAVEKFKTEFSSVSTNSLTLAEKTVIDESREQVSKADTAIAAFDAEDVQSVKSQYVCQILLHKAANYFETLSANGFMTDREANEFLSKFDLELRELRLKAELNKEGWREREKGRNLRLSSLNRIAPL